MNSNPQISPSNARVKAMEMLVSLWRDQIPLDMANFGNLVATDRAVATRLSREVLRGYDAYERFISKHGTSRPKLNVRAILHLALYELWVEGAAPHGVVNSWVEIAKKNKSAAHATGFINSLLRKAKTKPDQLNNQHFGKALAQRLRQVYGQKRVAQLNDALSQFPPIDLRLKNNFDLDEYADRLGGRALAQNQIVRVANGKQISALEGFAKGDWWVQDLGATLAADCFGGFDGRTLDIAAAPGGKTMQLVDRGAKVTAIEINPNRAKRIYENLARTGMKARVIVGDALDFDEDDFDRVLLDAPCSSTGTFRRHPDLRFVDVLSRLKTLVPLQSQLLDHSFARLKAGGELVYVTCSILPEEGEQQIEEFLARNPKARLQPMDNTQYQPNTASPYIRSMPYDYGEYGGIDGFFIAKIEKLA